MRVNVTDRSPLYRGLQNVRELEDNLRLFKVNLVGLMCARIKRKCGEKITLP